MKIAFHTYPCVPQEKAARNAAYALSLGLPMRGCTGSGALAVIGKGVSAAEHVEMLRDWPGQAWAINSAAQWCLAQGVKAALFSLDPAAELIDSCEGIGEALLSVHCDPGAFDRLIDQCAKVTLFNEGTANGLPTGTTTATLALCLSVRMGFTSLTFFGCEGQLSEFADPCWFCARVNGQRFATKADYFIQSMVIGDAIREFPFYVSERSGGLLAAFVADPDWDIECVSPAMRAVMNRPDALPLCEAA